MTATDLINLQPLLDKIADLERRLKEVEIELETRNAPGPEWITVNEAAEIIGVSAQTIYRNVGQGLIPRHFSPDGKLYRLLRSEVEKFYSRKVLGPKLGYIS